MVSLEECTSFCYPHLQKCSRQPLAVSFYVLFASLSTIPIIAIMYVFRWAENSSRLLLIVICLALLCFHLLLMLLVGVFLFALLILLPRNLLRHFGCDISLTVIQLNEEAQAKVHAFFPLLQMQVICYGRFFVFIRWRVVNLNGAKVDGWVIVIVIAVRLLFSFIFFLLRAYLQWLSIDVAN